MTGNSFEHCITKYTLLFMKIHRTVTYKSRSFWLKSYLTISGPSCTSVNQSSSYECIQTHLDNKKENAKWEIYKIDHILWPLHKLSCRNTWLFNPNLVPLKILAICYPGAFFWQFLVILIVWRCFLAILLFKTGLFCWHMVSLGPRSFYRKFLLPKCQDF